MKKKHFVALANAIKMHNQTAPASEQFKAAQLKVLATFCESQNQLFKRSLWFAYIKGQATSNGKEL